MTHRVRDRSLLAASVALWAIASSLSVADASPERRAADMGWSREVIERAASLPVQDGGRVKPLAALARFRLLQFAGSTKCRTVEGNTLSPTEWLMDCLFRPEQARARPMFIVQSSEVVMALGITPHQKRRDRYSYRELEPGREALFELAGAFARVPRNQRTPLQRQTLDLAQNVRDFEALAQHFDSVRRPLDVAEGRYIGQALDGAETAALSTVIDRAADIAAAFDALERDAQRLEREVVEREARAFRELLAEVDRRSRHSDALAIFAPVVLDQAEWLTLGDVVRSAFGGPPGVSSEHLDLVQGLEKLVRITGAPASFDAQFEFFHGNCVKLAQRRGEYAKVPLEVAYYNGRFLFISFVLFLVSFVIAAFSWLVPKSRVLHAGAVSAVALGAGFLIAGIVLRCIIRGRPPATTLYETILFATAVAVIVSLFIEWLNKKRIAVSAGAVIGSVGMLLARRHEFSTAADTMPAMTAVLDTNFWLSAHVTTIIIGYAGGLLAAAFGHAYILGRVLRIRVRDEAFYKSVARMVYGTLCFGLLFTLIGTVLGGVWASQSWGRFWGWDPKENGALLIVLWLLAALHARLGGYIRDLGTSAAAVATGMVVVFSWWGVNLLGVGLHSYGFTAGGWLPLMAFWLVEGAVILLALAVWLIEGGPQRPVAGAKDR